ncbi:hypothetical protein F444_08575 [Phytophthora nicotianae P1976]|uniref:Uncharacterized protein n=1 Tax=Phytophthora nicotianae P1976 TaxID=1317066 RepID=A0A081AAL8_PHYNI|nr:hypothetical protein F444_08575 [Phytophthora nicotianae P1976]
MVKALLGKEGFDPLQNLGQLRPGPILSAITKKSDRARATDDLLAKATAFGYFSQTLNLLRERYPASLSNSKRTVKIRDKMGSAIEERNLRSNLRREMTPQDPLSTTYAC